MSKVEVAVDKEKVIVKYKDAMYDITEFLEAHPGGRDILVDNNGKNIEEIMKDVGHSDEAYKLLEKYKIIQ